MSNIKRNKSEIFFGSKSEKNIKALLCYSRNQFSVNRCKNFLRPIRSAGRNSKGNSWIVILLSSFHERISVIWTKRSESEVNLGKKWRYLKYTLPDLVKIIYNIFSLLLQIYKIVWYWIRECVYLRIILQSIRASEAVQRNANIALYTMIENLK